MQFFSSSSHVGRRRFDSHFGVFREKASGFVHPFGSDPNLPSEYQGFGLGATFAKSEVKDKLVGSCSFDFHFSLIVLILPTFTSLRLFWNSSLMEEQTVPFAQFSTVKWGTRKKL